MLAVLSEINCLNQLQSMKVYPDFFSTSFDEFKNHVVTFTDCSVIIILAGINRFYRKHVVELARNLKGIVDKDSNIKDVIVITDATIPNIGVHYKMHGNLRNLDMYDGWKLKESRSSVLEKYEGDVKTPKVILSHYDRGELHSADKVWVKRKSSEDELIPLIQIPDLKILEN
jgi:hypothetical protein